MGYVLKAVLSSAQHPEYGQITVIPAYFIYRLRFSERVVLDWNSP